MTILRPFQHCLLMRRFVLLILLVTLAAGAFAQSHGLEFSSHEQIPEKRTSLNLTPGKPFCLDDVSELSFDFKFRPGLTIYFGYVMRLITEHKTNIDLIYNQRLLNFNVVIGESFNAVFSLDSARLFGTWNQFQVKFDVKQKQVSILVNQRLIGKANVSFPEQTCFRALFGANNFEGFETIDVPPMQIKDVRLSKGGKERYFFPLLESTGDQSVSSNGERKAAVKNPVWIKPRHQNWTKVLTLQTRGATSTAFDKKSELLYIVSRDSLYKLSMNGLHLSADRYSTVRDTLPWGNQSVYDDATRKLYNFYIDDKQVNEYDDAADSWGAQFKPKDLTVFWQANKFISPLDSSLYMIGGYGQLRYRNTVQRYHIPTRTWEVLELKGDFFMPRYMAGLGLNSTADTAFIIGGYGSTSGDQTINPKYNYDLLAYSVKNHRFHQLFHLKPTEKNFCFANSIVIPEGNEYYALTYPKDRFNSSLQLIRGSLRTPSYELMGDSIPYFFYDVESFADLYYCPVSSKLVAVTMHTSQQGASTVNVYTIDFPPNPLVQPVVAKNKAITPGTWWIVAGVALSLGLILLFTKGRRGKKQPVAAADIIKQQPETKTGAVAPVVATETTALKMRPATSTVYLFGRFEVIDKEGHNITTQFTPLLKELFLLMLIYSIRNPNGISPEKLYETLWSDKSPKDAKNNYSVNIVKLKAILEKIGESHVTRDSGKLQISFAPDAVWIDYEEFVKLIQAKDPGNKKYIQTLLDISSRGSFLEEVHYSWLDNLKSEISGQVIDILLEYASAADPNTEADLVMKIANAVFAFDQLNEAALEYKCKSLVHQGRHGLAKDAYLKFAKEYKENYGLDFERTFQSITGQE